MPNYHIITDGEEYTRRRFDFIKKHEESRALPYIDTAGIATIGIGFNLKAEHVRNKMLLILGINPEDDGLSADGLKNEKGYKKEIETILTKNYPENLRGKALAKTNKKLQDDLNEVMKRRNNDDLITLPDKRATFSLTDPESKLVFDSIIPVYAKKVTDKGIIIPDSKEKITLESLAFNTRDGANSLLGPKLVQAVKDDNHIEVCYQIAYKSNRNGVHAGRRYEEAHNYGCFPPGGPDPKTAKQALEFYEEHKDEIRDYELEYPPAKPEYGMAPKIEIAKSYLKNYGKEQTKVAQKKVQDVAPATGRIEPVKAAQTSIQPERDLSDPFKIPDGIQRVEAEEAVFWKRMGEKIFERARNLWGCFDNLSERTADKIYSAFRPSETRAIERRASIKGDVQPYSDKNDAVQSAQFDAKAWEKQFREIAPNATEEEFRKARIFDAASTAIIDNHIKDPELNTYAKARYYRQTAEDVQAGKGVPSLKMYDPQAEPTRVVRAFTLKEIQKDRSQEKERGIQFGA
jgi:hypothetical protein